MARARGRSTGLAPSSPSANTCAVTGAVPRPALTCAPALDSFELLGAGAWAERARIELRASGETARKRTPSAIDQLTPQELQITRLVAEGATNKEVAARLFLSPRTVDYHLRKVFTKLGISSRSELIPGGRRPRPSARSRLTARLAISPTRAHSAECDGHSWPDDGGPDHGCHAAPRCSTRIAR